MISFDPLWKTLIDQHKTKSELRIAAGLSKSTFSKLSHNESVTLDTIEKICKALKCSISDVVEVIPDSAGNGSDEGI